MNQYKKIKYLLEQEIKNIKNFKLKFYKTGQGDYAENDQFIGVKTPILRQIAKKFKDLPKNQLQLLLSSKINEERLLALFIFIDKYKTAELEEKEIIYQYYLSNLKYVNNWNLVDSSAHLIIGAHLVNSNKDILISLANSEILWYRRIAIVATLYFIRNNQFDWTIKLTEILLNDQEDLIHKACGWMLREVGKHNSKLLTDFLNKNSSKMPRTMLRYAIEKLDKNKRDLYINST